MELSPQTLHAVEFREARRNGYNTRDVDDFIERVAAGVGHLNERLREAAARAEAAEARLADAQRELDGARRRPAPPETTDTDETLRRTLVLAQRTADATVKEAKEEANRVLSEAREEAARTRAEAEAEARRGAEGARVSAQAEVETLIADRGKLEADIGVLTKLLDDQRKNIRSGIDELQRVLDDPSSLRPVPIPPLADVERPAAFAAADTAPAAASVAVTEAPNGHTPVDVGSPFGPGEHVAALQEPPAPAPAPADLGPPTQPVPFALSGEGRGPWLPSELRPPADEPLGPPPAAPPAPPAPSSGPPPAPAPGNGDATDVSDAGPAVAPDPGTRPSEWGKAVFDPDKAEGDRPRFGRRR
jgi:DivIVA domain-containing protein